MSTQIKKNDQSLKWLIDLMEIEDGMIMLNQRLMIVYKERYWKLFTTSKK